MATEMTDPSAIGNAARKRADNALGIVSLEETQREQRRLASGGRYELSPTTEAYAKALAQDVLHFLDALEKIARSDYRGNVPPEVQIAQEALGWRLK